MQTRYTKLLDSNAQELAKFCPTFWKALTGKRYILPQYRVPDYYNQEFCDGVMGMFMVAYFGGDFGPDPNAVLNAVYLNGALGLQEDRPVYFLEKELGEALIRTKLPTDLTGSDLHWRRRQMRIMLPKGLIVKRQDDAQRSLMYLDIGHVQKDELIFLSNQQELELKAYAGANRLMAGHSLPTKDVRPMFNSEGMVASGQISPDPTDGLFGPDYGIIKPIDTGRSITELRDMGERYATESVCDAQDDLILDAMQHLAFNILIFMGSVPLEYDAEVGEIRKIRVINERVIPGLLHAKFVGRSQYRPARPWPPAGSVVHTGRSIAAHWTAGYWRRQRYASKLAQSKLLWIEPYATGELRNESTRHA